MTPEREGAMRVELALAVALSGCVASQAPPVLSPAPTSEDAPYVAGYMCVFPDAELEERLRGQHAFWATIYKLPPESQACLVDDENITRQLRDYRKACESGEPGSADAVVENALVQCHAMPNQLQVH